MHFSFSLSLAVPFALQTVQLPCCALHPYEFNLCLLLSSVIQREQPTKCASLYCLYKILPWIAEQSAEFLVCVCICVAVCVNF